MQRYVEQMDYLVDLHRIYLNDNGQLRQGLTAQDKEQVGQRAAVRHSGLCRNACAALLQVQLVSEPGRRVLLQGRTTDPNMCTGCRHWRCWCRWRCVPLLHPSSALTCKTSARKRCTTR